MPQQVTSMLGGQGPMLQSRAPAASCCLARHNQTKRRGARYTSMAAASCILSRGGGMDLPRAANSRAMNSSVLWPGAGRVHTRSRWRAC